MREHTRLLAIPLRRPSRLDVVLRFGPLDRRQFLHQRTREHLVAIGHRNDLELALHIVRNVGQIRSEEHTSELQSLMRISYAVFCLKPKKNHHAMPRVGFPDRNRTRLNTSHSNPELNHTSPRSTHTTSTQHTLTQHTNT